MANQISMDVQHFLSAIKVEEQRNKEFLHITANENQMSETARMFLGSKISERYFMGAGENDIVDFGHFTAIGFKGVDDLVEAAKDAAKEMLGAAEVNLNVLSGVHAMMCAILSTTEPGDTVMTVPLEFGGHFATRGILARVGRNHTFADFDMENLRYDVEKIAKRVKNENVKAIYLDVSYYLNPHNLKEIREAVGNEVIIIYDASHTMGLIMGQEFQAPLREGADVVCANTHKTLPGPHKGIVAFRGKKLGEKANAIIDGSLYSTPHMNHLIALAVTILEMREFGKEYAQQIIKNSNALGQAFTDLGYEVRKANTGRFSENHQVHLFIDHLPEERLVLYKRLLDNNISGNFECTELSTRLYIRIGTAEPTRRGMIETEMTKIASLIDKALRGENVKQDVIDLNNAFAKIHYSFDN